MIGPHATHRSLTEGGMAGKEIPGGHTEDIVSQYAPPHLTAPSAMRDVCYSTLPLDTRPCPSNPKAPYRNLWMGPQPPPMRVAERDLGEPH